MNGSSSDSKTRDMDGQLAGLGYKVRSSELCQVAENMERLENAINTVNSSRDISQVVSDALLYDPSNIGLGSWVDTLLSELDQTVSLPYDLSSDLPDLPTDPNRQLGMVTTVEEDSGIRLVHTLITCADSVQRGDLAFAGSLIDSMQALLAHVNTSCGIGKVAGYFIDALRRRISSPQNAAFPTSPYENDVLYHHYYEACPYLKFAHFTANQAILEAFNGHDCVHVIDFNLMQGLQWPALIQALALRPGGPPSLRLTGVGPPSPDERDTLREIGARLAELAHSVNVRFTFRGVAAWRLEDVKPWMLQVSPKEAVAVNSIMQLHRVLGSGIDAVLGWIRSLNPKIVTVVEQEANHNGEGFLERFTEALHYYSTVFDSLEACSVEPDKALAEMYLQREICNVVCCEGAARLERHEPLAKWRERLAKAGFRPLHLGSNAYKQASMLLTLFSAEGYCVEENQGCLTLGWHSRPLIAASAWQAAPLREGETEEIFIVGALTNLIVLIKPTRGIPELIHCVSLSARILALLSAPSDCRAVAVTLLTSLAVLHVNKATIGAFPRAIHTLVSLLRDGRPKESKEVATALFALCSFPDNRRQAVECGVVPALLRSADSGLEMALYLLCCHSEETVLESLRNGALEICEGLLQDDNANHRLPPSVSLLLGNPRL